MNLTDYKGKVHQAGTGKYTTCRIRIRPHWQATDAPVTCRACQQPRRTAWLLSQLDSRIVGLHDGVYTISVIPDMPHITVEVPRADLRAWCERRLAARATHKNKGIGYSGGGPGNGARLRSGP